MAEDDREIITNPLVIKKYIDERESIVYQNRDLDGSPVIRSRIIKVVGDYFIIPKPLRHHEEYFIPHKSIIFFKIFALDSHFIEFESKVIKVLQSENHIFFGIQLPKIINRIQRRAAYRVPVSLPAKLIIKRKRIDKDLIVDFEDNVSILDLSLLGVQIASNLNVSMFEKGMLRFKLPEENESFVFNVMVKWIKKITGNRSKFDYHIGLEFVSLNKNEMQKLSKYITYVQLRERVKKNS